MTDARSPETDEALMARVQADVPDAFGALYDRFIRRALRLARTTTRDPARAEEIVQEAFVSVWRSRALYRSSHGSVGGWIMGVVRNRAIDAHRRHARHDMRRADEQPADVQQARGSVEESVGERDEAARLRGALTRLPAAQRDVITLAYFGELSTSEIANAMSLPLGTVKGRMRLGLNKLRTGVDLGEHTPDDPPPR